MQMWRREALWSQLSRSSGSLRMHWRQSESMLWSLYVVNSVDVVCGRNISRYNENKSRNLRGQRTFQESNSLHNMKAQKFRHWSRLIMSILYLYNTRKIYAIFAFIRLIPLCFLFVIPEYSPILVLVRILSLNKIHKLNSEVTPVVCPVIRIHDSFPGYHVN